LTKNFSTAPGAFLRRNALLGMAAGFLAGALNRWTVIYFGVFSLVATIGTQFSGASQ
jgi:ribose/xylose/arabinose/galactoside ABC-type transport system permease subunit